MTDLTIIPNRRTSSVLRPDVNQHQNRLYSPFRFRELAADNRDVFAQMMVKQRRMLGLTQQSLADRAGVARNTISGIERQAMMPSPLTLAKVSDALGLTAADLRAEIAAQHDREEVAA